MASLLEGRTSRLESIREIISAKVNHITLAYDRSYKYVLGIVELTTNTCWRNILWYVSALGRVFIYIGMGVYPFE